MSLVRLVLLQCAYLRSNSCLHSRDPPVARFQTDPWSRQLGQQGSQGSTETTLASPCRHWIPGVRICSLKKKHSLWNVAVEAPVFSKSQQCINKSTTLWRNHSHECFEAVGLQGFSVAVATGAGVWKGKWYRRRRDVSHEKTSHSQAQPWAVHLERLCTILPQFSRCCGSLCVWLWATQSVEQPFLVCFSNL